MKIEDVIVAPGFGGFFYDDQAAIRAGVVADGFDYAGKPLTPGFPAVRMPAESLGLGLVLSDGVIAWGDMMSVQYSGAAGRDPLFRADGAAKLVETRLKPRLIGLPVGQFRQAAAAAIPRQAEAALPIAAAYGLSQALLRAAAYAGRRTMAETICAEFDLELRPERIPLFAQSGDAREINVDKMILKRVDALPHGLINSPAKFGPGGELFRAFVRWVAERVRSKGGADYRPMLHFDVYGCIGLEFGLDADRIADFIASVAEDAAPFQLHVECPADFGSREGQIEGYAAIADALKRRHEGARIVADEYCNTLDDIEKFASAGAGHVIQIKMPDVGSIEDSIRAVGLCKANGVLAYLGGSCAETDLSAVVSVHVAVATQADMMLAKPGMGVDEAITIAGNEQSRLLAELRRGRAA